MEKKKKVIKTDEPRPFAEKHPKLNALLSLAIVLAMIAAGLAIIWLALSRVAAGVSKAVDWLSGAASKLDSVVIVALITGAVSILGVVLSSIVAKRIDYKKTREAYLAEKREKSYGAFVEMVYKIQQNGKTPGKYTEAEMLNDISSFSQELTLWGSKKVVDKWVEFRLNGANPDAAVENLFLLEEIMNEMREDMGVKRVKKGNLLSFFVNDIKTAMKRKE